MSAGRMRRVLVAATGLALLAGVALVPQAQQTEAAFTDGELAAGTFTAITVPTPVPWGSPECSAQNILVVGAQLTVRWRVPAEFSGYTSANAEYGQVVDGVLDPILGALLGSVTTTGTPSAYTTVVQGGLLSGLLGGSKRFAIRLKHSSGWVSDWLVADATFPALLGTGTCTLQVLPS